MGLHNTHEKVKRKPIPLHLRTTVWKKYHGDTNVGNCYCCGKVVNRRDGGWHCSHVKADIKGGKETVDNMRVCCPHCNLSMGDLNLYVYIRDNKLTGEGSKNVKKYFKANPDQTHDKRTNNWIKNKNKNKRKNKETKHTGEKNKSKKNKSKNKKSANRKDTKKTKQNKIK